MDSKMTFTEEKEEAFGRHTRPTLQNQVYENMRDALLLGRLRPGQRMTYRQLAKAMDVSVTPVREALHRLVAEYVLAMLPNGSVVVPILSEREIRELHEVTRSLEGLAARLGVMNTDPQFIEYVRQSGNRQREAFERGEWANVIEENYNMHFALYERADSPYLFTLIKQLWMRKGPHVPIFLKKHYEKYRGTLLVGIVDQLELGNIDEALERFQDLIDREFETWITLVRQAGQQTIFDGPIPQSVFL